MLDRINFASWQQQIRLYCQGKENRVNILKSIDEGPYQIGTVRETLAESTEGAPKFCPKRSRVYSHLTPEEKDRYNVDIRATNILLQGLPKDIYTLINHYIDAKDIWDNVKMLLEGSELTKEDRESQLFVTAVKLNRGLRDSNYDQLYAYLEQHETHSKENKMILERFSQPIVDPLALLSNVSNPQHYSPSSLASSSTQVPQPLVDSSSPTEDLIENLTNTLALLTQSYRTFLSQTNNQLRTSSNARNQARGGSAVGYGGAQNRVRNVNPGQARPVKCYNCNGGQDNAFDDDVDEQPVQVLALNVDNVFQDDECDAFDSDVVGSHSTNHVMANLSSADPVTNEARPSYDSNILSDVPDHDHYQDAACAHHEEHVMHDSLALYNGHEIIKDNHTPVIVHNAEDTLEIAEITRKKMNDKMNDPECVTCKVKIAPHNYSKENFLATFASQKQLTPEQIFWSDDLMKLKSKALKEQTKNPPYKLDWKDIKVLVSEGSPITTTTRIHETYKNVSQEIRDQLTAEAEAVKIILTRIDNDIYSTVDACPNACKMWKAIELLKQGELINVQDLQTHLYWEFGKFTSQDEWQRFVTHVKQSQELKTVSYHKLYDILTQHQHEVNEIRAERIARVANPLVLVAQQQPVYHPQNHPTHYTQNSSTRSQQAATQNRGKAIVNSP
nr:hypothetical protein [Tanacetum cinerariifolium]